MPKICLCVIADDRALDDGFERMIRSASKQIDAIAVICNGSADTFKSVRQVVVSAGKPFIVRRAPWNDDFSEQRNLSFELARELGYRKSDQWLFWMDCDDILGADTCLKSCIAHLNEERAHGGFMRYDYTVDPDTHEPLSYHYKERLLRADIKWRWIYPIHENCVRPIATRMAKLPADLGHVTHLRGEVAPKRLRNRDIVKKWYERDGATEPMAILHMAHQTFTAADELVASGPDDPIAIAKAKAFGAALKLYRDYINSDPDNTDFVATANDQIAEIMKLGGKYNEALDFYLQGIKLNPKRPKSYVGIAEVLYRMGIYDEAIIWAQNTRAIGEHPDTLSGVDVYDLTYMPHVIEAHSLKALGRYSEARSSYERARSERDDEFIRGHIRECDEAIGQGMEMASSQERDRELRRRYWGHDPHMSIAFYAPAGIEPWDGQTIAGGSGGTESTLHYVARHFRMRGWRVAMFANPPEVHVDQDGIEWYRAGMFHPDEPFELFVSLRDMAIFDAPINALSKALWLHDVTIGDQRYGDYGDRFKNIDAVICPSLPHLRHTSIVYGLDDRSVRCHVAPNGIDIYRIAKLRTDDRDPLRFVYASSPDRGLENLLDLWREIYEAVPGAKLDIYYGWNAIDAIIAKDVPQSPLLAAFKQRVEGKITDLRERGHEINWRGRVDHDTLIRAFWQSGAMLYPANFFETFGIVFAQAMACGVVPVVPNMGNLPELVDGTGIVVPGPPDSETFGARFVNAALRASRSSEGDRSDLQRAARKYDWANVERSWDDLVAALRKERQMEVAR